MIFADSYRAILKDLISQRPRGEIAKIADHLGVASTLLSQVLSGNRHLTLEQSYSVAKYFDLSNLEKDYFLASVLKDRTKDERLKNHWDQKLKEIKLITQSIKKKVKAQRELEDSVKSKFYSSYLFSAVRLYTSIGKGKTLSEISERFKISRQKAQKIVEFLLENNLITEKNGVYKMGVQNTHVPKESDYVYRHHANWRMKALSRLDEQKDSELSFTAPVSLDRATFESIRADILGLIEVALQKAHAAPAEELACITVDLFYVEN
jgi:uncharacterized protein (TIGR02147 family)